MKAGRGHVCNNEPPLSKADQTLVRVSPCRYRVMFDAPRISPDSLVMTSLSFLFYASDRKSFVAMLTNG